MKIWVLTREINEYDQDGSYFEAVFQDKPTRKQLEDEGVPCYCIDYTLDNKNCDGSFGGRSPRMEDVWWNLELVDLK